MIESPCYILLFFSLNEIIIQNVEMSGQFQHYTVKGEMKKGRENRTSVKKEEREGKRLEWTV